ncbi:hypothetical protein FMUND_327 [Fusarium mundagurra]|uniref:Uncharacterized protein n=1 Tax=Fusarium mundagurra TaxID=1567541 RepID=A0A8H5Z8D3_9HYPO|nr:hypothetical protein FMUND_327 [Fusarium mundagurra]
MAPSHTDNCSPDSYDGEPSATPQHSPMTSSPHELDYMDLDSQDGSPNWLPYFADRLVQFQGRHMLQHEDNRRENPTSVPGYCHGILKYGDQTQTQRVLQEEPVTQQTCRVSGTGHPGVAMKTVPAQDQLSQQFQQLSMNYLFAASGTATPVPNPSIAHGLYTHGLSFQTENMTLPYKPSRNNISGSPIPDRTEIQPLGSYQKVMVAMD